MQSRRYTLLAWLSLALLVGLLSGCGSATKESETDSDSQPATDGDVTPGDGDSDTVADGDSDAESEAGTLTIHAKSSFQTYLYYSQDGGIQWVPYPGLKMGDEGTGWYLARAIPVGTKGELHFVFDDGAASQSAAQWIKPKGDESCDDCHFIVTAGEVWIADGTVYDHNPDSTDADGDGTSGEGDSDSAVDGDSDSTADGDCELDSEQDSESAAPDGDSDTDTSDSDSADTQSSDTDSDSQSSDTDTDTDMPQDTYTVHLFSGWTTANLHYSPNGGTSWSDAPMTHEDAYWYVASVKIPIGVGLTFVFNNGANQWSNPVGGGNFSTSDPEVWVKDGVMTTAKPTDTTQTSYTVHLFSAWTQAYIHYSTDGGTNWTSSPGEPMTTDTTNTGWWIATVKVSGTNPLVCVFDNGASDWTHPANNPSGNFSITDSEVWIKNGVVSTTLPSKFAGTSHADWFE